MIASIFVGLLVLLIMYWWASSGAWSAFLHMLCVVVAGALAFALWEPVAYLMLAPSSGMSGYAFGLTLLGLFLVILVVLRIAVDRLVPANLQIPRAANLIMGGAFGAVSGVLTMGMFVIGSGYMQSTARIGDVDGFLRRSDVPKAPTIGSDNAPVLALVDLTARFYGHLSWGAFTPWMGGGTLDTHMPELTKTAVSLYRDSYNDGTARVGIVPASVSNIAVYDTGSVPLDAGVGSAPVPAYAVEFSVDQSAFDGNGQQFLLSASQARLVGEGRDGRATAVHPSAWVQATQQGKGVFYFSSPANYLTSLPGVGDATFVLLFPKKDLESQNPKFFQMKGVRFTLPQVKPGTDLLAGLGANAPVEVVQDPAANLLTSGVETPDAIWSLPVTLNSNEKGNLSLDDNNFILSGEERFPRTQTATVGSDLRIRGFKPSEGTRIVKIEATPTEGGVRLFPDVNPWIREAGSLAQDGRIALIDAKGVKYYAVGFVEDDGQYIKVHSSGGYPLTVRDVPIQTLGSNRKLWLYFRVAEGATIKYMALDTASGMHALNKLDFEVKVQQ